MEDRLRDWIDAGSILVHTLRTTYMICQGDVYDIMSQKHLCDIERQALTHSPKARLSIRNPTRPTLNQTNKQIHPTRKTAGDWEGIWPKF